MPRLNSDQLNGALKSTLQAIYVVTGDEHLLMQEACDAIRSSARKQGFNDREVYHVETGFKWDELLQSANSFSLFGDKKILELRMPTGKPGDAGSKALVEYCERPSDENLLLLILPKLDKRTQNSAWFKKLESIGTVVTVWPVKAQQLPRWLAQRLRQANLSASPEAITMLADRVEGNLLAAAQEIEKLKLLADDQEISAKTMAKVASNSARYDLFELVDRALFGDSTNALKMLRGLQDEGNEAIIILWALTREIRTLKDIHSSTQNGLHPDTAFKQAGVWSSRKNLVQKALRRMKQEDFTILVRQCAQADRLVKGAEKGDIWALLQDILLRLSGTPVVLLRENG